MTAIAERVTSLRQLVERRVASALGGQTVTAMIDFPNYPNVGDSAIYLGQLACLASLGIPLPRFICDFKTYDRRALAEAAGDGAILLTGGGSFGDLWPTGQEYREEILRAFPDNRVIHLPQTLHFQRRDTLDRARRVIDGHRNLKLFWRDERSLETAQREFNAPSELCPDMAFCLGSLERPRAATSPILWLLRADNESAAARPEESDATVADWVDEPYTLLRLMNYGLTRATIRQPASRRWRSRLMGTYTPLANERLRRGLNTLSAGDVVITDRLHGHILAVLLGISHVILDNTYGKLSTFHATWTSGLDGVRFARSPGEARDLAKSLR